MNSMADSIMNYGNGGYTSRPTTDNLIFQLPDGSYELHLLSGKILVLMHPSDNWGTLYERIDGLIWALARHNGLDTSLVHLNTVNDNGVGFGELSVALGPRVFKVSFKKDAASLTLADYTMAISEIRRQVTQYRDANSVSGDNLGAQANTVITTLNWLPDWLKNSLPKYHHCQLYNQYWRDWETDVVNAHEIMTRYYDM